MDKIKNQLQENYEDALFALLMDEYAQAEGKRLYTQNEDLKNRSDFNLPDGMKARGFQAIRKAFRKKRVRSITKATGKVISRVAVIVLVLNIAFGVSFFTVEAFRVEVLNMALNYQETHTTVQFVGETIQASTDGYTAKDLELVLPEGYVLDSYEQMPDGEYALFIGPNGARIMWDIYPLNTTVSLDTEDADYSEKIKVGSNEGILVEKSGITTALWCDTARETIYCITADMDRDNLLEILTELTK